MSIYKYIWWMRNWIESKCTLTGHRSENKPPCLFVVTFVKTHAIPILFSITFAWYWCGARIEVLDLFIILLMCVWYDSVPCRVLSSCPIARPPTPIPAHSISIHPIHITSWQYKLLSRAVLFSVYCGFALQLQHIAISSFCSCVT